MKALAVFPSERRVRWIERPTPRLSRPEDVLLRIHEVGICGTDREIASFLHGEPPAGADHWVIGHEALAEVVEIGSDVRHLKVGDWVIPIVRRPCPDPECRPCRSGAQDFCRSGQFRECGIQQADGFMTEFVVDEEAYLVRVPPALREVAVLIEPLTVASKAAHQFLAIEERLPFVAGPYKGLVLGAGPVGLLGAMVLVSKDIQTFVYSREPETGERAKLIHSFGAHYISSTQTPLESLAERTGLLDIIFEAVGVPWLAFGVMKSLGPNGVMILSGVPAPKDTTETRTGALIRDIVLKNQLIFGTVNAGRDAFMSALQSLEQFMILFPDSTRRLISDRLPPERAAEALQKKEGIKQVIRFPAAVQATEKVAVAGRSER